MFGISNAGGVGLPIIFLNDTMIKPLSPRGYPLNVDARVAGLVITDDAVKKAKKLGFS